MAGGQSGATDRNRYLQLVSSTRPSAPSTLVGIKVTVGGENLSAAQGLRVQAVFNHR